MALFSSKKNKKDVAPKAAAKEPVKVAKVSSIVPVVSTFDLSHDLASMILRPRVTEKATMSAENGVYVFEVSKDSTKTKIAKAVAAMYKVTPLKVRVVSLPAKCVFVRGKWGEKTGIKKAYVYLKKGDKIEII